ncbi:hypothetical protein AAMO2058_000315700 [Amorphochlora amoebiformis]
MRDIFVTSRRNPKTWGMHVEKGVIRRRAQRRLPTSRNQPAFLGEEWCPESKKDNFTMNQGKRPSIRERVQFLWDMRWILLVAYHRNRRSINASGGSRSSPSDPEATASPPTACWRLRNLPMKSKKSKKPCAPPKSDCREGLRRTKSQISIISSRSASPRRVFLPSSSPNSNSSPSQFSLVCSLCRRPLEDNEIFMYKDHAHCSSKCRSERIRLDSTKSPPACSSSSRKKTIGLYSWS